MLTVVALLTVGCAGGSAPLAGGPGATDAGTSATEASTGSPVTESPQPNPSDTPPPETPPDPEPTTTLRLITSNIAGAAAAGNSGGIGEDETNSHSEVIRNDDGTCSGWSGRDVPAPWTEGLISGAEFVILARDSDEVLGEGNLATSSFENVDTGDREQWLCTFPFSATITGAPDEFRIKVADLDPWVARRDPTRPGQFIASVNTVASIDYFTQCTSGELNAVFEWNAVGSYWSDGIQSLCSNGLTVADIDRPCRHPGEGSDYVTRVASAEDPSVVYEDAEGLHVDVSTLPPGAPVVVSVATGRPCG